MARVLLVYRGDAQFWKPWMMTITEYYSDESNEKVTYCYRQEYFRLIPPKLLDLGRSKKEGDHCNLDFLPEKADNK